MSKGPAISPDIREVLQDELVRHIDALNIGHPRKQKIRDYVKRQKRAIAEKVQKDSEEILDIVRLKQENPAIAKIVGVMNSHLSTLVSVGSKR